MATTSYRPTALERAYASHLLQSYFSTPHSPTDDESSPLRVSGRQAVPFLTTSNIDRSLLRLFWTVADPEGVGTLVTRNQFHVLLRLVAMAQAHFLPPFSDELMNDGEKIAILTNALQENSHLVIALPTFSADSNCPSVAYLLATFPSVTTTSENAMNYASNNDSNGGNNNAVDVSNMLTNHDLQYQLWQQQQNQQTHGGGGENNNRVMSVSDAFGSLPEVEDRPLPSLQFDTPTVEDVKSLPPTAHHDEGEMNNDLGEVNDDFGDFDSNTPIQTNGGMESDMNQISSTSAAIAVEENDEDDFGGFESTQNNINNNYDSDVKTESSAEDNEEAENGHDTDDFGDFSDSFPQPVPAVVEETTPPETNAAQTNTLGNSTGQILSISDAFGSLVNQEEDSPIQFGEMAAFEGGVVGDANDDVNDCDNVAEEDDFGNFGSADTAAVPSVDETSGHNDGDFASDAVNNARAASNVGMSVFDALGDVEDKPLPPLGGFPSIANESAVTNSEEVDDDGFGFGSFEASVEAERNSNDAPAEDSFGTFEGAAATTMAEENAVAPAEDSFGTFEDAAEETVESTEPINDDAHIEDSFGTFEGAGGEENMTEIEKKTEPQAEIPALTSYLPSPTHSDPFGSLPEVENLPLPPLSSPFFEEEKKTLDAPTTKKDNDGFGDFGSSGPSDVFQSAHSEAESPDQMVVANDDDFGGFESSAVATENVTESDSNDDAAEDDFGAFGDSSAAAPVNDTSPEIANLEQSLPTPTIDADFVSEEKKSHEDADIGEIPVDQGDCEEPKPSFGMSAFDAFGDIQDAPLPPLNGFAPTTNNEIETTKTGDVNENNNDETFGAFGMGVDPNIVEAPVDDSFGTFEGAAVTAETSNVDAPVEDSFGTFEGGAEATAEPEAVVADSFGTFEGATHETSDNFTSCEVAAEETTEAKPSEEGAFVEDSFGTFEGVGEEKETTQVAQNIAAQAEAPATSFGLPSPSLSDPFGSLPEIENLPLPPLTSPPLEERKLENAALEAEENKPDSENDGFGEFGSVPINEDACDVLDHESKQIDGDDFGKFESTTPQVQVNEDVNTFGAENDDDFGDFGEAQEVPVQPDAALTDVDAVAVTIEEDGFGDFGEAQDPAPPVAAAPTDVDAVTAANEDEDFGDFGEAQEIPAPPLYAAPTDVDAVTAANEEEDFGDFGEAQEIPAPPLYAAPTDVDAVTAANEEEDFGDFGEAQVSAPPLETAPTDIDAAAVDANNTVDTDFGFGDWGSGDWQGQVQEGPDMLSGGFDAFSTPAPELTSAAVTDEQATSTTPNGENDDEFGSFEAPKNDVTQDEGSDGFVFVENTEPNSQFDSFGEFSSPANESFSPFDSGADEENIMQPKLEDEHTDGFGDFSSFDNGAQQPEEVKEGSEKSSLSRQELIGSEYTNLMESWANIVSTVKSDVERGQKIIEYVSSTLPPSDRAIIFKSSKLQNHILGLAEFVRVVRCIAATIADVFCLSDNIDLQASQLPEWNDNPIIADAITIETLWSELSSRVVELDILPHPPQLETVTEIRARATIATVQQKTDLCHLTLQPFSDKLCTQSSVDWNDNKYMACAANLLLHRMT